jgi:LuxR family maltose regulon positive regulatory protein
MHPTSKHISVLENLAHAGRYRLVLIIAPQNFEVIRDLQNWSQSRITSRKSPPFWVDLSLDDDDPIIFLNRLLQYILECDPNILDQIDSSLIKPKITSDKISTEIIKNPSFSQEIESLLTLFINKLIRLNGDRFLILVNYHVIHDINIHRMVEFLIDYLPQNFHLIITSEDLPQLQIGRLRAKRELLEIIPMHGHGDHH